MTSQSGGFFFCQMDHRAVFGRREISRLHHSFVETSQVLEIHEVGSLDESEVMGVDAVDVVHQYPFVFSDTLPEVGSFAGPGFEVVPARVIFVITVDSV